MSVNFAFAQPQIKRGIVPRPGQEAVTEGGIRSIPDNPDIRQFTVAPDFVFPSDNVTFRWFVRPGAGGSTITSVNISCPDLRINFNSNASGERTVAIPSNQSAGRYPIVLSTSNQAGRVSSATVNIEVGSMESILERIAVVLHTNPLTFIRPAELDFYAEIESPIRLTGVDVSFTGGNNRILKQLTNQVIPQGRNRYSLGRYSGIFTGSEIFQQGCHIVISYQGYTKCWKFFAEETCSINPAPRSCN